MNNKELVEVIQYEKSKYLEKFSMNSFGYIIASFFKEPVCGIMKWQIYSRKCDFYSKKGSLVGKIWTQYYRLRKNYYGRKMNIEASTSNIGKGLLLYHSGGIIINGSAIIGENCHLHGMNCIGNAGEKSKGCPKIGNNVTIGVGACIIGEIEIADGIIIGAGAVVNKSFYEPNIILAGVPAKKIYNNVPADNCTNDIT